MEQDERKRLEAAGMTIDKAGLGDVEAVAGLLKAAGLPHEDMERHVGRFLVARWEGGVVGAVGAEVCGPEALLRSLVVAPEWQGRGVAAALVGELEKKAGTWGVRRWWLLTMTAQSFFERRGFRVRPRSEAPLAIGETEEFRELCPAQAVCMSRERRSE